MQEAAVHYQVLGAAFAVALVLGAVMRRTNFCTMGAVSDWINMDDLGRLRAWLLAMAVAIAGVLALEAAALASIGRDTLPPYRGASFAWLRYAVGGFVFGVGMTLASGCGVKTLVRTGGGNLKSLVVAAFLAAVVYLMYTTRLFELSVTSWSEPATLDLARFGVNGQDLGALIGAWTGLEAARAQLAAGVPLVAVLLWFVFKSRDFRASFDHILAGIVVGLAVVIGWYLTAGPLGAEWREYAMMAGEQRPLRVGAQSFTFTSPIGDAARYLAQPGDLRLLTFGVVAVGGVVLGAALQGLASGGLRLEWFASGRDFAAHAAGGVLMGLGGFAAMGCTIGQGVSGVSTLALGSFIAVAAMIAGAALTMKIQYRLLDA